MNNLFRETLVIAPHADDETIGCGGTIAKICKEIPKSRVHVVISTVGKYHSVSLDKDIDPEYRKRELESALGVLSDSSNGSRITHQVLFDDKEGILNTVPMMQLVTTFDTIIADFQPTAVLIPYPSHHQDHQTVYQACVAALRPNPYDTTIQLKAMYEYPFASCNYNPALAGGKLYVDIDEYMDTKIEAFMAHESQVQRQKNDLLHPDNIKLLGRSRGMEICKNYAEAFYLISSVM